MDQRSNRKQMMENRQRSERRDGARGRSLISAKRGVSLGAYKQSKAARTKDPIGASNQDPPFEQALIVSMFPRRSSCMQQIKSPPHAPTVPRMQPAVGFVTSDHIQELSSKSATTEAIYLYSQ